MFGCSTDPADVNQRFQKELGVRFPILSDEGGEAAKELGILGDTGHAKRTTYLVDAQGTLREVWYDVKVDGHAAAVTKAAESLG